MTGADQAPLMPNGAPVNGMADVARRAVHDDVTALRVAERLISAVSHDLRSPLTVIIGAATSLERGFDRFDEATRKQLLTAMREEAERLSRRVDLMMALVKTAAHDGPGRRSTIEIGTLVRRAQAIIGSAASSPFLNVRVDPSLPAISTDPGLVEPVIVSLVERALQQSPKQTIASVVCEPFENGVSVTIRAGIRDAPRADIARPNDSDSTSSRHDAASLLAVSMFAPAVESLGGRLTAGARQAGIVLWLPKAIGA